MATLSGKRIVDMVWHDITPSSLLTAASFDNAVRTVLALSGSTNAVVHLIAMARRCGFALDLDRFDALARSTPVLANVRPSRSEEHTSELQSLMRISYAVFCLKTKNNT